MTSIIHHIALDPAQNPLEGYVTSNQMADLIKAVGKRGESRMPWAIKIPVAPPGLPALVKPAWLKQLHGALGCGPGSFTCDTVSFTTRGLEDAALMQQQAARQGFDPDQTGFSFMVADEDETPDKDTVAAAPALAQAKKLAVMSSVRPHPHLGYQGVLADVGLGLISRAGKFVLHRDIRPQVDTPLCAGCGSCLDVCLYDAIRIHAGRAHIDHQECTGCGECMTTCFMAGISPTETQGSIEFQKGVALAVADVLQGFPGGKIYFNLLVGLDRFAAGPGKRMSMGLNRGHLLAGSDPVAIDQSAWDLLQDSCSGSLKNWHGYHQEPEVLLATAEDLNLGSRGYRLHPL